MQKSHKRDTGEHLQMGRSRPISGKYGQRDRRSAVEYGRRGIILRDPDTSQRDAALAADMDRADIERQGVDVTRPSHWGM